MTPSNNLTWTSRTGGDVAVDGLLAGVVAGATMIVYLIVSLAVAGRSVAATLLLFDATPAASPLVGLVLHLAVSAIYGLLFGLAGYGLARWRRWRALPTWAVGLIFGLLLLLLAQTVLLPGSQSALNAIPALHWAVAHIVYGLALGVVMRRLA